MLMIEAASPKSGRALHDALSEFGAEVATDSERRCFVWVRLGGDLHAKAVFDAISSFVTERGEVRVTSTMHSLDDELFRMIEQPH